MDKATGRADAAPDDRPQAAGVSLPVSQSGAFNSSVKTWMCARQQGELVAVAEAKLQMMAEQLPSVQITKVAAGLSDIDQRHKEQ